MEIRDVSNQKEQSFIEYLNEHGYTRIKVMQDDTVCALQRQLYTVALVVGLDRVGYERRYCYEREYDACEALVHWDGKGDPPGPWVKEKPSDRHLCAMANHRHSGVSGGLRLWTMVRQVAGLVLMSAASKWSATR